MLRGKQPPGETVTWSKTLLSTMAQAIDFKAVWKHHVPDGYWIGEEESHQGEEKEDEMGILPRNFYQQKGEKPLTKSVDDRSMYGTPPNTGDGAWIIDEFLKVFVGDSGARLFSGDEEAFPHLDSEHVKNS